MVKLLKHSKIPFVQGIQYRQGQNQNHWKAEYIHVISMYGNVVNISFICKYVTLKIDYLVASATDYYVDFLPDIATFTVSILQLVKKTYIKVNWASSRDHGTYHIGDQRRLRQACIFRTVSPEPSLFAHMKYGSRPRVRPQIRHLVPLNDWACTFEEWVYGGRKVPYSHDMAQSKLA